MSDPLESVFDVASRIDTPLALGGLVAAVLFFVFRQLLAMKVFPRLTRGAGARVLVLVVNRVFYLALIGMFLGTLTYVLVRIPGLRGGHTPDLSNEKRRAQQALEFAYSHDFSKLFDVYGPFVQQQYPFSTFKSGAQRELSQFPVAPEHRRFDRIAKVGGFLVVTFLADFDRLSTWREIVTFSEGGSGWELYNISFNPVSWPPPGSDVRFLSEQSAMEIKEAIEKPMGGDDLVGRWVQPAGLRGRVVKIGDKKADYSCDFEIEEAASGEAFVADGVLGGCALGIGDKVVLVGRVEKVVESILIGQVRFWVEQA